MSSVIIAVVVVLGIIVAGGFLLYFLGDLLMSISGKKKDSDAIREKQLKEQKNLEERVNALENSQEAKNDPTIATVLYNGGMVEAYNPDEDVVEDTTPVETPVEATEETTEEQEETPAEEDSTAEYIRQRRKELLERLAKMQEEREAEETTESEDTVDLTEESEEVAAVEQQADELVEETAEETPAEEPVEEETTDETTEEVVEETPAEETPTVEERVEEEIKDEITTDETLTTNYSLEELEARLAEEQEKLKANEKELRKCKKEYIPLRRVKNTLESDENKLRRKEALVAKQKVVLYGVNNYADIDEEKAQKLAEDLDLLDGLKLSVQHCQEVMDKNQDRYPLLEQIYNLLTSQNEQIKNEIKTLQDAIAKLNGDTDAE